jgi:hypothetical protein
MNLVRRIREIRKHAEELVEKSKSAGNAAEIAGAMAALNDKLYSIEERLVQYRARAEEDLINYPTGIDSKLARLFEFASMADAPPTQGDTELLGRLSEGISDRAKMVDQVEHNEYATLVRLAGQ